MSTGESEEKKGSCCIGSNEKWDFLMHPSRHVVHSIMFVTAAILTVTYIVVYINKSSGVILSNFKILKLDDMRSFKDVIGNKDDLLKKWTCTVPIPNSTQVAAVEPWGPDSMCRCIRSKSCNGKKECEEIQNNCMGTSVLPYAQVYAGYESSYYNIFVGLLFLHISVIINLYVETDEEKRHYNLMNPETKNSNEEDTKTSETEVEADLVHSNDTAYASRQAYKGKRAENFRRDDRFSQYSQSAQSNRSNSVDRGRPQYSQSAPTRPNSVEPRQPIMYSGEPGRVRWQNPTRSNSELQYIGDLGHEFSKEPNTENTEEFKFSPSSSTFWLRVIKSDAIRLFVAFLLAVLCLGFSANLLDLKLKSRKAEDMDDHKIECTLTSCLTEGLIITFSLVLSILDVILFIVLFICTIRYKVNVSVFNMTIWEDIHSTAAFMLLISSFTTMSGVHDDTTVYFDLGIVMFLGFLQSLQHLIMLQREEILKYCEDDPEKIKDSFGTEHTVETTVLSYFLYSRLFLFLVIICTVFVFTQRIEPSMSSNGFEESWYYFLRNLTLLLMLTPSVISDISYEYNNFVNLRRNDKYIPYVGAQAWRRTVFLAAVIFFCVVSIKSAENQKFEKIWS